MLAKRIIPCLDVKDGRVVKGTQFLNLRDAGDPIELAKEYDKQGADEVVFLDITASSDKRSTLIELVEHTAKELFIPFSVGGGINDMGIIADLLKAGVDKVSINTAAVKNPDLIKQASEKYGAQCIIVAIDAKRIETPSNIDYPIEQVRCDTNSKWEIYTHGGRYPTGIDVIKWAQYMQALGAGELLLTSMDADGSKDGYDVELYAAIESVTSIPLIASGGAGTLNHISDVLQVSDAALLASLLHYKETTVQEIKTHCSEKGLSIRHS